MRVELREKVRRIVGGIVQDVAGLAHAGQTAREIYDALTEDSQRKFVDFANLVVQYLRILERVQYWKEVHKDYSQAIDSIGEFRSALERAQTDGKFPLNLRDAQDLSRQWVHLYEQFASRVNRIVTRSGRGDPNAPESWSVPAELEDYRGEIADLLTVNDNMKAALASGGAAQNALDVLDNFLARAHRVLDLANELMVAYLDAINDALKSLQTSLTPVIEW